MAPCNSHVSFDYKYTGSVVKYHASSARRPTDHFEQPAFPNVLGGSVTYYLPLDPLGDVQ